MLHGKPLLHFAARAAVAASSVAQNKAPELPVVHADTSLTSGVRGQTRVFMIPVYKPPLVCHLFMDGKLVQALCVLLQPVDMMVLLVRGSFTCVHCTSCLVVTLASLGR